MEEKVIEVRDLTTRFGDQIVHDHLSFDIYSNEILSVIGGSGSGKTVLFGFLTQLEEPQSGIVDYYTKGNVGILFQAGGLLSSYSVLENVMFPLVEGQGMDEKTATIRAKHYLSRVNILPRDYDKFPSALSGGMTKRVGLARALVNEPKILFLDEPTSGLDPIGAQEFDEMLLNLKKEFSLTCIMITHDLYSIFGISDRVAVLVNKKVVTGTLREICKYDDPWVKNYFNGPRARIIRDKYL